MSEKYLIILPVFITLLFSGCSQKNLSPSQAIININSPIKIATWYPEAGDGLFTAMGLGRLAIVNDCLVLTNNHENLLLILPNNSYSWDKIKQLLTYENKSYKIGDELYLGGGAFTYNSPDLPFNQIDNKQCHFDRVWLAN